MKTIKELDEACLPYLNRISEMNRKYNFNSIPRTEEDKIIFQELWKKIKDLQDEFDRTNVVPPCKRCGAKLFPTTPNVCFADACKEWLIIGG